MQTKFKKGDRVRAVQDCRNGRFKAGQEGFIDEEVIDDVPFVKWDNGARSPAYFGEEDSDIELIEPRPRIASEMTLREHYAGLALNAFLSNSDLLREFQSDDRKQNVTDMTNSCVLFADDLIQALNEKQ